MEVSSPRSRIFIQPPPNGYDLFRPELPDVRAWAEDELSNLPIVGPEGPCTVSCLFDETNPAIINASAGRLGRAQPPRYIIRIHAGLPYWSFCFSKTLRIIGPELSWFPGLRLDRQRVPLGVSPEDALAKVAFSFMCVFCVHHELAHIYMGHIDCLMANGLQSELREAENGAGLSLQDLRAMEAEADRMGVAWTAAAYSRFLGANGLGNSVVFPSEDAAWDFFGLTLTLQCVLMQQACPASFNSTHPNANERSFVMFAVIDDYFARRGKSDAERARFRKTASKSRIDYADRLGLEGGATLEGNWGCFEFMSSVGKTLDRMNVSRFRMKVAGAGGSERTA